jgi:hypothetical protein
VDALIEAQADAALKPCSGSINARRMASLNRVRRGIMVKTYHYRGRKTRELCP